MSNTVMQPELPVSANANREDATARHLDIPPGFWQREETHFPQPLSPASRSIMLPLQDAVWREEFARYGILADGMEMREIGGWVYQRLRPLGGKDQKTPPLWILKLMMALPPLRGRIRAGQHALRTNLAWRFLEQWEAEDRSAVIEENQALRAVPLRKLDDDAFLAHLDRVRTHVEAALRTHYRLSSPYGVAVAELLFACQELLGWEDQKSITLLSGLSEMSSTPARELARIALLVEGREATATQLQRTPPPSLEELRAVDPEIAAELDAYLHEYGCRALRYDFIDPSIEEDPDLVVRLLADQITTGYNPLEHATVLEQERQQMEAEAQAILADRPADQARFATLLDRAQRVYPVREENEFHTISVPTALGRYALLEAGRRLVARGQLREAADVMQLEWDEVVAALTSGGSYMTLVEQRLADRAWTLANPGPPSYGEPPPPPPPMSIFPEEIQHIHRMLEWEMEHNFPAPVVSHDELVFRGIPVSAGTYTGPARIVMNESEFDRIQAGDVLVCPITSPVWSVLFSSIGALVTEGGGMLSHPAIIAREHRIPAVVAVGEATSRIKDGQLITVDGLAGEVRPATTQHSS